MRVGVLGLVALVVVVLIGCPARQKPAATVPEERTSRVEPEVAPVAASSPASTVKTVPIEIQSRTSKPSTVIVIADGPSTPAEDQLRKAMAEAEALFEAAHSPADFVQVVAAYQRAIDLAGPSHRYTGILRYQQAWSWYRGDAFAKALHAFWPLVDEPTARDLRPEILQYLAIIIAEHWTGEVPDPERELVRPEVKPLIVPGPPWLHELAYRLGSVHADLQEWRLAADAYDLAATRATDPARKQDYSRRAADARERATRSP